jgi:hypothetical protein
MKTPQTGRFSFLAERLGENPPVRQICLEQIWTAEGRPWSAKRGRVGAWLHPTIPSAGNSPIAIFYNDDPMAWASKSAL